MAALSSVLRVGAAEGYQLPAVFFEPGSCQLRVCVQSGGGAVDMCKASPDWTAWSCEQTDCVAGDPELGCDGATRQVTIEFRGADLLLAVTPSSLREQFPQQTVNN